MIVALTLRQWRNLVEATGLEPALTAIASVMDVDLDDEGGRFAARELIGATLKPWVLARTLDELREIFDRHGVSWGPYQTFTELVERDPRCSTANPMFSLVEQPDIGTYLMPGSPLAFSNAERLQAVRAPLLGEHTDEVLADVLGLADHEIARLHDTGVVAGPTPLQAAGT
jgi:2-methylfumaryl-CoA isomerase